MTSGTEWSTPAKRKILVYSAQVWRIRLKEGARLPSAYCTKTGSSSPVPTPSVASRTAVLRCFDGLSSLAGIRAGIRVFLPRSLPIPAGFLVSGPGSPDTTKKKLGAHRS